MFFYVSFDGKEVVVNEIGSLLICIRLGVQPSTGPSSRSRAEIQQDWAGLLFGCGQRLINVPAPINGHYLLLVATNIEIVSGTSTTFGHLVLRSKKALVTQCQLRSLHFASDRANEKH